MATAMVQAPGDRRTKEWERLKSVLDRIVEREASLEQEKQEALQKMQDLFFQGKGSEPGSVTRSSPKPASEPEPKSAPRAKSTNGDDARPRRSEWGTKKEFVEEMFRENEDVGLKEIQVAWNRAGNKDTISASLVYKTKSELKGRGEIGGERRPRGPRKSSKSKETSASSHAGQSAGDIHTEVRRAAWEILSRNKYKGGLQVEGIIETIEAENLVGPLDEDDDLAKIIQNELKALREEGKVERGDNRQYHIVEGAELD